MCLRAHVHVCVHAYDMSVGGQVHKMLRDVLIWPLCNAYIWSDVM